MPRRLTIRHATVKVDGTEHAFSQGDLVPDELVGDLPPSAFAGNRAVKPSAPDTTGLAAHQASPGSDPAPEDPKPYGEWSKDDLEAEAERRGLTVEGTGADGNVLKDDLVAALQAGG